MKSKSRLTVAVSVVAAVVTVLSGCSSSGPSNSSSTNPGTSSPGSTGGVPAAFNASFNGVVNPSTKAGGTLNLLSSADCDSWDPQRTYYGWCWNMQRLFSRSLIGYQSVNGTTFKLAPDLATDMGTHNADFSEWTYTLKPGLTWSNGQPITPKDVQYGVERLWATDVINGGPSSYFTSGIKAPKDYKGPYKNGGDNNVGMTTTANSITFHLTGANADFNYLMAMAASAPVPYKTEGGPGLVGATYTKHPMASGPYMVASYTEKQQITFVRNPKWDQSTDTIHHPLVDKVVLTIDTDPTDIDNKLKAGSADANASTNVSAAFQAQILTNPDLKKNADDPVTAFTQYMPVFQSVITNQHCRAAIFYASNKAALLQAYGGAVSGQIAGSMTPPGIAGNDPSFNPYPVGADNTGDLAKAKSELTACGQPNGFATKMAYATPSQHAKAAFQAEQTALARVGIKVTGATADSSTYYSTFIGSPQNIKNQGLGIALAGWGADFPTGVGFYQSIANGNSIVPTGNTNYVSLNDPTVNKVLDEAPAGKATDADWQDLDKAVMAAAVYMPIYWGKNLYYRNPRLTNVTSNNALAFGIYDFVNVGVGG
jgi:peptide/nickel transport system substrate-binding protein